MARRTKKDNQIQKVIPTVNVEIATESQTAGLLGKPFKVSFDEVAETEVVETNLDNVFIEDLTISDTEVKELIPDNFLEVETESEAIDVKSEEVKSEEVKSEEVKSEEVKSEEVKQKSWKPRKVPTVPDEIKPYLDTDYQKIVEHFGGQDNIKGSISLDVETPEEAEKLAIRYFHAIRNNHYTSTSYVRQNKSGKYSVYVKAGEKTIG